MWSNVRAYTDSQLLERVEMVGGTIPNIGKYLSIGVESLEDQANLFDDKFYIFDGPEFKMVTTGTTNAGLTALRHFDRYDLPGAAVWKTNEFYEDLYVPGMHKGRMKAFRQVKPILYYRDSDRDDKAEEQGTLYKGIIHANMHGVSYDPFSTKTATYINGWSFACQVMNRMSDYRMWRKAGWKRNLPIDYVILEEW